VQHLHVVARSWKVRIMLGGQAESPMIVRRIVLTCRPFDSTWVSRPCQRSKLGVGRWSAKLRSPAHIRAAAHQWLPPRVARHLILLKHWYYRRPR